MPIRLLQDMECSGKTVVIRQDLNVPMKDGRITNDKRIRAALPGIRMALDKGAGVILLSHLGRPTEGVVEEKFSLAPVAAHLSGLLGRPVKLAADLDAAKAALEGVDEWTAANIDAALEPLPEQMDLKKRVVFQAVRVAVCGNMVSPPLGETMALVGCDDCLARIDRARTMAL